jgi:hypothetical protein
MENTLTEATQLSFVYVLFTYNKDLYEDLNRGYLFTLQHNLQW